MDLYQLPGSGAVISADQAFDLDGVKYPAGWLSGLSAADILRMGLTPFAAPATGDDVNAERARRILGGVVVMVPDHGAVALGGSDVDMRNLQGLAFAAQLRIAQGQGGTLTTFRDNDNVDHQLTQPQVLALWSAGAEYISDVFKASWALKDQDPIPADFAADQFWP